MTYDPSTASDLETWARDLTVAYEMAVRLVTTSFVPATYQGKPEEAAAAIITGQELGLSPMAALRSIDIIHGVPGMRAIALRALVQSSGHEIWTEEQTATRAVVKGRRKGSDKVETSTWTIERASQMQLTGKDNWKKQPIAMLLARATSELARLIASDVLLGIPYSIEELEDLGPAAAAGAEPTASKPAAKRTVKRAVMAPADVQEPELPGETPAAIEAPAQAAEQLPYDNASEGARALQADDEDAAALAEEAEVEEQRRRAAEAFAQPTLEEPTVDWEPPVEDVQP